MTTKLPPKGHRELELKFDIDEAFELPSFAGLDGVARVDAPVEYHLEAMYYDTPDLRLAAAGIALRRRTGGHDAGWHLKQSVTVDERLETQVPLGANADGADVSVPAELLALVRSRVRDRPLAPIASLDSRRTVRRLLAADGSPLAEIADDSVIGTRFDAAGPVVVSWREVEVELIDGDRDVLAAAARRLGDTGARPAAWGSKLGRVLGDHARTPEPPPGRLDGESAAGDVLLAHLREQVETLVRLDPLVRRGDMSVHEMRVATRRLRSALATFRRLLDRSVTDPVRDELRWVAGVLGDARDTEVIEARLDALVASEPAGLSRGPVARRVRTTMSARTRAARRRVAKALDSDRYLRLLDGLDTIAAGGALAGDRFDQSATKALAKEIRRSFDRWRSKLDALRDADEEAGVDGVSPSSDVRLHEVRKASERVRYAGEAVAPVLGKPATRLAGRMEELQEVLGRHQDGLISRAVLVELAAAAHAAGEDSFTYGRLHALEQARSDEAAEQARELLARWPSKPPAWLR